MRKQFESRMSMMQVTLTFLNARQDVWAGDKLVAGAVASLNNLIREVAGRRAAQLGLQTKGATKQKSDYRTQVIDALLPLVSITKGWAKLSDKKQLYAELTATRSELERIGQQEFVVRAEFLLSRCEMHAGQIDGNSRSPGHYTAARECLDRYAATQTHTRSTINSRSGLTTQIRKDMQRSLDVLEQLDLVIAPYAQTHPEFYQQYRISRNILGNGTNARVSREASRVIRLESKLKDLEKQCLSLQEDLKDARHRADARALADEQKKERKKKGRAKTFAREDGQAGAGAPKNDAIVISKADATATGDDESGPQDAEVA